MTVTRGEYACIWEVRVRFGWYYEGGGNCCAEGDDLWQLIGEAVREAGHRPINSIRRAS